MKSLFRILGGLLIVAVAATACGGDDGSIEVEDARYRLSRADLGAGYMTVTNGTDSAVTLEAARADGIGRIELHESMQGDDGTMSMVQRPDGFVIDAGATISLQPGGKHLMLFDPEGTEDVTFELDFGSETVEVVATFDAEASADAMSEDMGEMDDHDMDDMDEGDGMSEDG